MPFASANLFDPISGDLLPNYREEYVQGRLDPELTQTVETYLKDSPIQANIVLGRAQSLLTAAEAEEGSFVPPSWVQEQLRYQPTVSAVGPLRRPVVRLVLGLFLLLSIASVVQWLRNEPLVPAPVARAVAQAASSATRATRRLVQRFTAPSAAAPAAHVAASRPVVRLPHAQVDRPAPLAPIQARMAHVAVASPPLTDSVTTKQPAAATAAEASAMSTVHGRITDSEGRPLPGATVLVQGTREVASTNATGYYLLTAPIGSTLQFGYGGYADQLQHNTGSGTVNVVLVPRSVVGGRR